MTVETTARARGTGALLAVLVTGQAMATMDSSIVAVAVNSIRSGLHASGAALQMIASGYVLSFAVLVVTGARLGDLWGRRRLFLAGVGGFTVTSAACGLAPSAGALVGARIAQGAMAALMVPQVLSLIQRHFDGEKRARAIGVYSFILALGVAGGQIAGGLIVTADLFGATWRPALLVNVPIGIGLLVAASRVLPPDPPAAADRPRPRLDPVGAVLLAVAMAALVVPVELGRESGWPIWTWCALAAGAAGVAGFWRHEERLAAGASRLDPVGAVRRREPLVDPAMLRAPGMRPALASCCLVMGCYSAFLFTVTLHLQSGLGFTPLHAGLAFLPYTVGFGVTGLNYHRLPQPIRAALPIVGPLAFAVAVLGLLALLAGSGGWPDVAVSPLLALAGAGHAAGFSPLLARMTAAVAAEHASALSGVTSTGTLVASAAGVVGVGSLYLAVAEHDPSRSVTGLDHVAAAVAALLLVGTGLAARAVAILPGSTKREAATVTTPDEVIAHEESALAS